MAMVTLLAQIAPQRSTQYSELASALAPAEFWLSGLAGPSPEIQLLSVGGQQYLKVELPAELDEAQTSELGRLAMTSAYFRYYEQLGGLPGPFLRPIETGFSPVFPLDLVMTRRYRGKTNESLTFFMLNVARYSSAFCRQDWNTLRVFDPLAGGGTTLFAGLVLGADVSGVDQDQGDVESTATFLKQYCQEQGIVCKAVEERVRKVGHRWSFTLGKGTSQRCVLAHGDTVQALELVGGLRSHLIVTDLPYGIQHQGALSGLLGAALPVWTSLLLPGEHWCSRGMPRAGRAPRWLTSSARGPA